MKHKHYKEIARWAGGAVIQSRAAGTDDAWTDDFEPHWWNSFFEFRVKPEEKKPVVRWLWAGKNSGSLGGYLMTEEEAKNTGWDLRLEWSRTEFPE